MASRPGTNFDGTAFVTFNVSGTVTDGVGDDDDYSHNDDDNDSDDGRDDNESDDVYDDDRDEDDHNDDDIDASGDLVQAVTTSSPLQQDTDSVVSSEPTTGGSSNAVSFSVTYYHCNVGTYWDRSGSSTTSSGESSGTCEPCTEVDVGGNMEVCSEMG